MGKATAGRLQRMGLWTVRDLLFHFPHRHEDWSAHKSVAELVPGQEATVHVTVQKISGRKAFNRKGLHLTNAVVNDDTGTLDVIWFNQPFLVEQFPAGTQLSLSGKVDRRGNKMTMSSPKYEVRKGDEPLKYTGRLLPVYPLSLNLTQRQVQFLVSHVLHVADELVDPLPADIRHAHNLLDLPAAVKAMHAPLSLEQVEAARKRFAFEELFCLQLQMHELKRLNRQQPAQPLKLFEDDVRAFVKTLPFELTEDQKKTAWKIFLDLQKEEPMNRLVQGDVGSGKTVVAAMAMYNTALNGLQSALMAPTEVLAHQHFLNFSKLFSEIDLPIVLATRSQRFISQKGNSGELTKRQVEDLISSGQAAMAIGTHTLIQGTTGFKGLGLAVVDEQHRFGVEQRKALRSRSQNGFMPHLLSMTATPIPRTLMLAMYGDLAVSSIRTRPKNRLPIMTKLAFPKERAQMYEFMRAQLKQGRQAYVVCPLIEESDTLGVASVEQEAKKLMDVFSEFSVGVLHGKLTSAQKDKLMRQFKDNKIHMLVATTVIEVGVDVPNATVMLIEGAERFGLSQLHQIRGRVGRSDLQSYCYLAMSQFMPHAHERLKKFIACRDGFEIAELDLSVRGAGEMLGTKQSGVAELQFVNLGDTAFLEQVQQAVSDFIKTDGFSSHPEFADYIAARNERVHLE